MLFQLQTLPFTESFERFWSSDAAGIAAAIVHPKACYKQNEWQCSAGV